MTWNYEQTSLKLQTDLFTNQNRPTDIENNHIVTKGEGGER